MPSAHTTPASSSNPIASQPAAKYPPKSPDVILAEAEAQWLFTELELRLAPSILDGMSIDTERELRTKGVNFILQVGIMLKLPQLTLSTAAVFFNRFLMRYSLVAKEGGSKPLHHYQIAAVSLFLATKTEENIRRTRELIVACCRVAQKNANLIIDEQSKDYWRWRDTLLLNEDVLLETLCFDLTVESPHKLLFDMLKSLGAEHNKKLRNAAWAFVNDTCLTQMCLLFSSKVIAAAAVFCGAKYCGPECRFPDDEHDRPWWTQQGVKLKEIWRAANYMADLYEDQPPKQTGERSIYVGLRTPLDQAFSSSALNGGRSGTGSIHSRTSGDEAAATATAPGAAMASSVPRGDDGDGRNTHASIDGRSYPAPPHSQTHRDSPIFGSARGEGVSAGGGGFDGADERNARNAYRSSGHDEDDDMNFDDETRLRNDRSLQTPASPAEWLGVNTSAGGSLGAAGTASSAYSDRGTKRDRDGTPRPNEEASGRQEDIGNGGAGSGTFGQLEARERRNGNGSNTNGHGDESASRGDDNTMQHNEGEYDSGSGDRKRLKPAKDGNYSTAAGPDLDQNARLGAKTKPAQTDEEGSEEGEVEE